MKKLWQAIIFLLCTSPFAVAQIDDTLSVIYGWTLENDYQDKIRSSVDTLLDEFQNYFPPYREYTGIATLGNYGLPVQSTVFFERDRENDFFLTENYSSYMRNYKNAIYYNTKKPFSQLRYINSGSGQTKEEIFEAFHTQNVTRNLNAGLHYTTAGSLGDYSFQKVKRNTFSLFSSYSGDRYAYHLSINWNKIEADENGGVLEDYLVTDTTFDYTKDIPTLFGGTENPSRHNPDVYNEIRNMSFFTMQEISIRRSKNEDDTSGSQKRILYPKIYYIGSFKRTKRKFVDEDPQLGFDAGLYPNINISNDLTHDSTVYWNWHNSIRLQFQGRNNNHYYIDYSYELLNYSLITGSEDNTVENSDMYGFITDEIQFPGLVSYAKLHNSFVSSGFSRVFGNQRLQLDLYGRMHLTGYKAGDFTVSGEVNLNIGSQEKPVIFMARGVNQLQTPDFLKTYYISNNYIWSRDFSPTITNHLSTKLTFLSNKLDIQADYYLFRDLIFFNYEALPEQYKNNLSVISVSASKRFDFWRISSISKLVYQKSENDRIIGLPDIVFYNSTYLKYMLNFKATGGKILTMIGFDFYYNTKYYADAYMPALSTFHRQHTKQLGNYPYFNAFLNAQLKRFRFFMKLEHVNYNWIERNYFSVLHYPLNARVLKFGLSWTFYD